MPSNSARAQPAPATAFDGPPVGAFPFGIVAPVLGFASIDRPVRYGIIPGKSITISKDAAQRANNLGGIPPLGAMVTALRDHARAPPSRRRFRSGWVPWSRLCVTMQELP